MPNEFEPREIRELIGREKFEHINHVHPHPQHHDFGHHPSDDDDNNPFVQLFSFLGNLFS